MNKNKLQISISLFQDIAFRIQSLQSRIQNFEEKKKKIAQEYYSELNDLIVQEINLKNLLSKKCFLENFSQFQSIILDGKILGNSQNNVLSLLLLFQTQPQMLAKSIFQGNTQIDQKFMNYILNDFYSDFLNSQCNCKANLNKYVFIYLMIQNSFNYIKSFDDLLDNSRAFEIILNGLIKNPIFFKFSKGLYKTIKKSDQFNKFIAKNLEREKMDKFKNSFRSNSTLLDCNSKKYENLLFNNQDKHRNSFLSQQSLSHEDLDELKQNSEISNDILAEMLEIFIKCIRDYLPSSIKYFYFLLKIFSEDKGIDHIQVVTLFFLQRFIVKLMSEKQQLYKNNPMKSYRMEYVAKIVQHFPQYCQKVQRSGYLPMKDIIQELCYYPDQKYHIIKKKIKELNVNEQQTQNKCLFSKESFNSSNTKASIFTQENKIQYECQICMLRSKDQSEMETEDFGRNTIAHEIKSQLLFDLESKKSIYKTKKFYSLGGKQEQQIQDDQFYNQTQNFFDQCSFHWEATFVTYENLGYFIDLYECIGESQDLLKIEVLRAIQDKNLANKKYQNKLKSGDVYILFSNQLKNSSLDKVSFQENPYEKLFSLNQMSYNKLEDFDQKSIYDFLRYFKKNIYTKNYDEDISIIDLIRLFKSKELSQIVFTSENNDIFNEEIEDLQQKLFVVKIQQLNEKLIIYEKQIEQLYLDLIRKKEEILLIKEQKNFINDIQKVVIKQQLHGIYAKVFQKTQLDLCVNLENQQTDNKILIIDGVQIQNVQQCNKFQQQKDKNFEYTCIDNMIDKNHIHFKNFEQFLDFFLNEKYAEKLVLQNKYSDLLLFIIDFQKQNLQKELDNFLAEKLIKEINKIYKDQNYVKDKFQNYQDKILYNRLFPLNQIKRDEGFQVSCQIFGFIDINHFYKFENSELIQQNLGPIIKKIKQIEFCGSWQKKVDCVTSCFQKLAKMLEYVNKNKPGSEEMQPLITYAIIKAKPFNMLSNLTFMSLLNRDRLVKGQTAFILTNIEIAIQMIEKLTPQVIKIPQYNQFLLEKEVQTGIHLMRKRSKNNFASIKNKLQNKIFIQQIIQ